MWKRFKAKSKFRLEKELYNIGEVKNNNWLTEYINYVTIKNDVYWKRLQFLRVLLLLADNGKSKKGKIAEIEKQNL